ncbi:MAG: hypothetical protein WCB44_00785 [Stellaceae bacterium]
MLTRDILFGMNMLSLAGFVVMGLTLTLNRMGQAGKGLSIGLMTAGTALVFIGLYAGGWSGEGRLPRPDQGFTPPYDISYRAVKLPRVSAAHGRI